MTPGQFRALLVFSVLVSLADCLVDFLFPALVSPPLSDALAAEPLPPLVDDSPWLSAAIFIPFTLAAIAGPIGLFFFRPWARSLSLAVTVSGLAIAPFIGPTVASGLSMALLDASMTSWGAVLAVAYWSPVSQRFRARSGTVIGMGP